MAKDNVSTKTLKQLQDKAPELIKNNKGALIGAGLGYLLSEKLEENPQIMTTVLGLLAGSLFDSAKEKKEF